MAMGMVPPGGEEEAANAIALGLRGAPGPQRGRSRSRPRTRRPRSRRPTARCSPSSAASSAATIKLAISGAAPIAPEILEFFYAAGVPVFEGWGMTETTSIGTLNLPDAFKFGTIGRPVAGADVRIAEDGEIEMAGDDDHARVLAQPRRHRRRDDRRRLPAHRRPRGDRRRRATSRITGRKKDIIITAGGKNLTPANLEGDLRRSRWISQAVMFGDRKPYPVALITLDAEEIVPWAEANGLPTDVAELAEHERGAGD